MILSKFGDFESGISLTEFLARFNHTCDETNPASVYGALTKSAIDIERALFLADLRDKDLMVKYVLNWEKKNEIRTSSLVPYNNAKKQGRSTQGTSSIKYYKQGSHRTELHDY